MRMNARTCALLLLLPPAVAQAPAARLDGIVLDAHQQPVRAARVEARHGGEVLATTFSDATGLFAFGRLPMAVVALRVTTDAPDVGGSFADLRAVPRAFVRVAMMPARAVSGTVHDAGGAPVAGAFVAMAPLGPPEFGAMAHSTTSDENGRFAFAHVPFGDVAVRVWAAGHAGAAVDVSGTDDATVACVLADEAPQRRTFVLADASEQQRARAELRVRALAGRAMVPLPEAVARPGRDAEGAWQVLGWPGADEMRARVEIEGALVEPFEHDIPPETGDRTKTFYVEADENAWIRGRLVAVDDDVTAAGRRLLARVGGYGVDRVTATTTDADGTFELLSPAPTHSPFLLTCLDTDVELLNPAARDWLELTEIRLQHKPDRAHELAIRRAAPLAVTVLGRDGGPCAGATVLVLEQPAHETTSRVGGTRVRVLDLLARGSTDAEGRASLTGPRLEADADVAVHVTGPGGYVARRCVVDASVVEPLVLDPGATLRGRVERADGTPWPGAHVTVMNFLGTRHAVDLTADREGAFTVRGLGAGPTTVGLVGSRRPVSVILEPGKGVEVVLR